MKTIASFLFLLAFTMCPAARSASLNETLQKGLVEEETNRNLTNAINAYQDVLHQYDAQHQAAATAAFRLAECYAKLGRTNDAITLFRRVTTEFTTQGSLAAMSRQRLNDLGAATLPAINRSMLPATDQRQLELLDQEVQLIQRQIASINNMIQVGRASTDDLIPPQRNMLELQRKMAEIEGRVRGDLLAVPSTMLTAPPRPREKTPEEREAEEIERWKKDLAESPDLVNRYQGEPLLLAAASGKLKLVEFLLDHGADITLAPKEVTVLHVAIDNKNLEMLRLLLKKGAAVDTGEVYSRVRPLALAAYKGWMDGAKALLDAGASPNVRGPQNLTPLHFATLPGNLELVKLLLAKGAEINGQDDNGTTPLLIAISKNFNRIADCLLEQKADVHILGAPLLSATVIENAIKHEPLPSPTIDRYPPIFPALQKNSAMVEPLLQHGASIAETNAAGQNFVDWCVAMSDTQSLKANVKQFSTEICSRALLSAICNPKENTLLSQCLLENGASVLTRTENGYTPMHLAAFIRNEALVKLLVQHGADINATNHSGFTPLDESAYPELDGGLWKIARSLHGQADRILPMEARPMPGLVGRNSPLTPRAPSIEDVLIRLGAKHSAVFEALVQKNQPSR